jgi:hypothetical protein
MNMNDLEKQRLRHTVLSVLVSRHPKALTSRQILHRAAMEVDFRLELEAVESALHFLMDLGDVVRTRDDFGRTEHWQATAGGVLREERKG